MTDGTQSKVRGRRQYRPYSLSGAIARLLPNDFQRRTLCPGRYEDSIRITTESDEVPTVSSSKPIWAQDQQPNGLHRKMTINEHYASRHRLTSNVYKTLKSKSPP
jgi:hypothetical protein